MPIWHQSPKLTPRYFLETPRLFGYPKEFVHIVLFYVSNILMFDHSSSVLKRRILAESLFLLAGSSQNVRITPISISWHFIQIQFKLN